MPEWLIGAVLKTVEHASVPWVRIPLPPILKAPLKGAFKIYCHIFYLFLPDGCYTFLSDLVGSESNIGWACSPNDTKY